ncbi:DUF1631 family protein [Allohahella marinimesophila]|uniref:DUF1631 family protein n=1 Tax=Allohahella marinimesophila TaxID=1054972 RepID=UPI0031E055E3
MNLPQAPGPDTPGQISTSAEEGQQGQSLKELAANLSEALMRAEFSETRDLLAIPNELMRAPVPDARTAGTEVDQTSRHELARSLAEASLRAEGSLTNLCEDWIERHDYFDRLLANSLVFIERICTQWSGQSGLEDAVRTALLKRRFVFAALLIDQPEFILDPSHPVAQLLNFVEQLFAGWESAQGPAPGFVSRAFDTLQNLLDDDHVLQHEQQVRTLEQVRTEWQREQKRRQILEQRLTDSELGQDLSMQAESLVAQRLNAVASHFQLPVQVIEFLQGVWQDSMLLACRQHGPESKQYRDMHVLCDRMVFAFREIESELQRQKLFGFAAALSTEVGQRLGSLDNDAGRKSSVLATFDAALQDILRGKELERQPWPVLAAAQRGRAAESAVNGAASGNDDVAVDAAKLMQKLGPSWFRRGDRLCKALIYLPWQQAILWSDFAGRKVLTEPLAEVLAEAEKGILTAEAGAVPLYAVARRVGLRTVQAYLDQKVQASERFAAEKVQRETAREKAQAEAAAILLARENAQARADEEKAEAARQMQQAELDSEAKAELQLLQAAREQIDAIHLGGSVQIRKNGEMVNGKLAVRLNATGKLIFVNDLGLKLEEILRDDAVQRLLDGDIIIRDAGQAFEARLARAVGRIGVRN